MADYELHDVINPSTGLPESKNIEYMNGGGSVMTPGLSGMPVKVENSLGLFLFGGTGADGKSYPKVDMSLWDQATMCGTCHVGGPFYEQDRQGNRLPARLFADWGPVMTGSGLPQVNPLTTTVWESFDPTSGLQTSQPTFAPWIMPMFVGNDPTKAPIIPMQADGVTPIAAQGSVPMDMTMKDPNTGADISLKRGQLLMPNVKEMDCLFCHMKGYNNVMASVMTQAGNLAFAPTAGSGLMNPLTQSYDPTMGVAALGTPVAGMGTPVSLSAGAISNMLAAPDSDNCMQCHATRTLKNLPEMFGTTGTSNGFLSSAPMVYDPPGNGPLGKRMVSYDINAAMLFPGQTSPVITMGTMSNYMMPGLSFPQAMGPSLYNGNNTTNLGGGNAGHSGPLYYSSTAGATDQNTMKRSTMPFPRAEWFKRGDAWQAGKDLHGSFGCAGCHFTGDTTHKNQCDPGRGFDMMSGIQDGIPPLKNRNLVGLNADGTIGANTETPDKHDTRNTVKRCEFCHITGQDYYGQPINTFGAPNPTTRHQQYGLTANIVQIVDKYEMTATGFGGQGVPQTTDAATLKADSGIGSHLDVMDCTVCHVQKQSMMVRTLDATSGMRFPSVLGTDPNKGMFSLFEDPATTPLNNYAAAQYNAMYTALNMGAPYVADANGKMISTWDGAPAVGGNLQAWKPLHTWQKNGNMDLPLTTPDIFSAGQHTDTKAGLKFRRKIYLSNPIVAAIWNNTDSNIDANGDGANGGILTNAKASLVGYKDIFTGNDLTKNNTQGYGEPIFDPWIMRDLKVGFNFGPAPLSVISVGFGDPATAPYGTAYDQNGLFTGEYKYVSVWSGAVILTEPDQIRAYKNYRTSIKDMTVGGKPSGDGKSWAGTELALVGDPFTVTHGIQPVTKYALGKSCADCHAAGAGFFNGDFNMTGTAIPADRTYDPSAMLQTTTLADGRTPAWVADANAYLPVLDANGELQRNPGLGGAFATASDMMSRPLEPYRVKAYKGDLRTSFEGFNKLGQPRTTEFLGCDGRANPTAANSNHICTEEELATSTLVWSVPLQRSDALYPPEKNADGSDLKIYCKAGDDCVADNTKLMDGREFATYLEDATQFTMAKYGIGTSAAAVTLTNDLPTTASLDATGSVTVNFTVTGAPAGATFRVLVTDGTAGTTFATNALSHTFTKTGIFTVTSNAIAADGTVIPLTKSISIVPYEAVSFSTAAITTSGGSATIPVCVKGTGIGAIACVPTYDQNGQPVVQANPDAGVTSIPVTLGGSYDQVVVTWGDGSKPDVYANPLPANVTHKYLAFSKFTVLGKPSYNTYIGVYLAGKLISNQRIVVTP